MTANDVEEFHNHPSKMFIWAVLVAILISIIFCAFFITYEKTVFRLTISSIFIPVIIFILINFFYQDLYNRPLVVLLDDHGLTLKFKFKKDEIIPWDGLKGTFYKDRGGTSFLDNMDKGGCLYFGKWGVNGIPMHVDPSIVMAVRKRYYKINGRYPDKRAGSD